VILAIRVVTLAGAGLSALALPGRLSRAAGMCRDRPRSLAAINDISHVFAGRGTSDVTLGVMGPQAAVRNP